MILSGSQIKEYGLLIGAKDENYQAHGCDVTLERVYHVVDKPYGEKIRESDYVDFRMWSDGYYHVPNDTSVLFKLNEVVDLTPKYHDHRVGCHCGVIDVQFVSALILPKSSLSRRGITVHSAWWDVGYKGSGVVLVRTSSVPLIIQPGDSFAQIIFFEGNDPIQAYNGNYQGEGIKK